MIKGRPKRREEREKTTKEREESQKARGETGAKGVITDWIV